jgi:hypothetical protein
LQQKQNYTSLITLFMLFIALTILLVIRVPAPA